MCAPLVYAALFVGALLATPAGAHIEPSEPDEVTVAREKWQGKFRLYGERVSMRGTHVHYGAGPQICTGLERRGAQGFGCGFFPRESTRISVGWGTGCEPHPNGFVAGVAKPGVAKVVARFTNGRRIEARLYPSVDRLDFSGKFWVVIHNGALRVKEVRAFGSRGRLIHREKGLDEIGSGVDCS